MERGRCIVRWREHDTPNERRALVSQDKTDAHPAEIGERDGHTLRLGQRRMPVCALDSVRERSQLQQLCGAQRVDHLDVHRRNLTRYRERVGLPRSPKGRATLTSTRLAEEYPGTANELCALDHATPFQLLAATILSAQCTDVRVNLVTPALFAAFPDASAMAQANPEEVEDLVRTTGFFRAKTRSLIGMAIAVMDRFGGDVPTELSDLVTVPGVGRKTGNVLRSVDFNLPGLPVDTHVLRLSRRLGLTEETDPVKVEHVLNDMMPPAQRGVFSLRLILHGRATCKARRPLCSSCVLADFCPKIEV